MTTIHAASFYELENWVGQPVRISRFHPRGKKVAWINLPQAYPSVGIIKSYRGKKTSFQQFTDAYVRELEELWANDEALPVLEGAVDALLAYEDVTLLCYEPEGEPCHRQVLARWLKKKRPSLKLGKLR